MCVISCSIVLSLLTLTTLNHLIRRSTSSAIRQSSRTTLRQTIQPDEEAGLLRDSSLSPGLHGERPLLLVRFTGYHWLVVIVTVSLGTIKTVLVRTGHSATVNYLDLTIAVPVALGYVLTCWVPKDFHWLI